MDVHFELEDLPLPAAVRVVVGDVPGPYREANRAFLEMFGIDVTPSTLSDVLGETAQGLDEIGRRVVERRETVNHDLRFRGRRITLQKSPVIRDDAVVAVLTVVINELTITDPAVAPPNLGHLADNSMEAITLLEIHEPEAHIVSQNRARLAFDQLLTAEHGHDAEHVGLELLTMARQAAQLHVPFESDLVIGDRHFTVRSDLISEMGAAPAIVSQTMVDISDRSRSLWLEHLVDVAASQSLTTAAERSFTVVRTDLNTERAALLRFDGQIVDLVASTDDATPAGRRHVDAAVLATLRLPGVVQFPDNSIAPRLLDELGIRSGAAISIIAADQPWGTLVIGSEAPSRPLLTTFAVSMLESLASTLGMIIERNEGRELLQESNRRLEAYAHAAAHDLRSPLRRIRSFSQILQARLALDEIDREQLSDFAERIAGGAERLDALLESMLEHATISTLAAESAEYSDLQTIATDICAGVIELSHDPKPVFVVENLPEVRLPHDAAERVLRNLIDNALKYSPEGRVPEVELRGEAFDQGIRVRVRDNGIGIEPQFAEKVFQLFNQLRSEESGSGVGLAVVERLLSTRGAKIWVESDTRRGATFVIEFPQAALRPPELVR